MIVLVNMILFVLVVVLAVQVDAARRAAKTRDLLARILKALDKDEDELDDEHCATLPMPSPPSASEVDPRVIEALQRVAMVIETQAAEMTAMRAVLGQLSARALRPHAPPSKLPPPMPPPSGERLTVAEIRLPEGERPTVVAGHDRETVVDDPEAIYARVEASRDPMLPPPPDPALTPLRMPTLVR